jgi:hypothetical protein
MNQLIKIMKKLLEKIKNALLKAFGVLLDFLVKNGEVAIKVTNTVKEIINNPAIDWVVALTPTDVDDKVLAEAKKIVPALAVKVGLAMNIVTIAESEEDEIIAFSTVLAFVSDQLSEEGKAIFYRELSGLVAESLSDGTMSGGEAVAIVQLIFKKII